jgi:hypothetical protein
MIASDRVAVPVEQGAHDRRPWAGIVCTVVAALFLAFDAGLKLLRAGPAVEGTTSLGYPADSVAWIGGIELGCLALYLVPRTAPLGALLMTAYLGGAVATHVRVSSPLLTHTFFPVYVALLLWAGLYLRDPRLRALAPLRNRE